MNDKSSGVPDAGTSEEPALTQRNTATVGGEQDLGADGNGAGGGDGGSGGAAPTYGPAGNTTDAEEEGADGHGI
ncbi:MAG TPA: hypothetical protein VN224_02935 [Xanthomonadales bacterium]|nr:hypothetical protein [Xanthomonadales bacterium]